MSVFACYVCYSVIILQMQTGLQTFVIYYCLYVYKLMCVRMQYFY